MLYLSSLLKNSKNIIYFLKLNQILPLQLLRYLLVDHVASNAHATFLFRLVPSEVLRISFNWIVSVYIAVVHLRRTLVVKMDIYLNRRLTEINDESLEGMQVSNCWIYHIGVYQRDSHRAERVLRQFCKDGVECTI